MTQHRSIETFCALQTTFGLFPQERAGATTTLHLTATDDVTIPLGAAFATTNGTKFSILTGVVLNSGNSRDSTVTAIHGDYSNVTVRASGEINEKIELAVQNLLPEVLAVSVNGEVWTRVRDLFEVDTTSQVFRIFFNDDNTAYVQFGDGVYGQRLPADAIVSIDHWTGGGPSGNGVAIDAISRLVDSFANSANINLIENTSVTTGGTARQSLASIKAALPAQQRQVAGLINKQDIPGTLKRELSWLQDATVSRGFANVSGIAVPTSTVVALPYSSDVSDMTAPQQTELSAMLANRGELGVQWNYSNAKKAPVALQARVKLANRNLSNQKDAEIKKALNAVSGTSPFAADTLSFNRSYTGQEITEVIASVDGVTSCFLDELYAKPFALSVSGTLATSASFIDVEIDADSEDGFYEFTAVSTTAASATFNVPFRPDQLGTNFARDTSQDFMVHTFNFGTGSGNTVFNDVVGPYVSCSAGRVVLRQTNTAWKSNQFSGTTWKEKYILGVEHAEGGLIKKSYYHIQSNTFDTITTSEVTASALNGGFGISASLSQSTISNVKYSIYRDMSFGLNGTLVTPTDQTMTIKYNNENTLFFSSSDALTKVPSGEYSHIRFTEPVMTGVGGTKAGYSASLDAIRVITSGALVAGDKIRVYTTPLNSNNLSYKHYTYCYTLSDSDIVITFI